MGATFRKTWRWQQLRLHIMATRPPWCAVAVCHHPNGRTIDMSLSGRHRWGPQVDHVHEVADGGDWWDETNLVLAHAHCNNVKGLKRRSGRKQETFRQRARRNLYTANPTNDHSRGGTGEGGGATTENRPALDPALSWSSLSETLADPAEWCPKVS